MKGLIAEVSNCSTLKITKNVSSTFSHTLTYMQILRNNQKQNNATIKGNRNMQCKKRAFRDFVVVMY